MSILHMSVTASILILGILLFRTLLVYLTKEEAEDYRNGSYFQAD